MDGPRYSFSIPPYRQEVWKYSVVKERLVAGGHIEYLIIIEQALEMGGYVAFCPTLKGLRVPRRNRTRNLEKHHRRHLDLPRKHRGAEKLPRFPQTCLKICSEQLPRHPIPDDSQPLPFFNRDELAEAEVAAVSKNDRTIHRLFEAQFEQSSARIGLHETILAAKAMEVQ